MSEAPKDEKLTEEAAGLDAAETAVSKEASPELETTNSEPVAAEAPVAPKAERPVRQPLSEEERAARLKAAAEMKAKRAAEEEGTSAAPASAQAEGEAAPAPKERPARVPRAAKSEEPEQPKEPSPKQPLLDKLVADLQSAVAEDAVAASVINEANNHLPTITVKAEHWYRVAMWLRDDAEWKCNYLRNLSGVDLESEMEVVYHMIGLTTMREVAVHVKTSREEPSIDSVTPIWETANWNEREVYDLLGIDFPGHPDLRRIMMPDDWVGHPLRKDYEPLDSEV